MEDAGLPDAPGLWAEDAHAQMQAVIDLLSAGGPALWACLSCGVWVAYLLSQSWVRMGRWDKYQLVWGLLSVAHFLHYVLISDRALQVQASPGILPLSVLLGAPKRPAWSYGARLSATGLA